MASGREKKKLTDKERVFVEAYCGVAKGNATEAARIAGYGRTPKSTVNLASRLLAKVGIRKAIEAFQAKREQKAIAGADERDEILTTIARNGKPIEKIKAINELNKVTGRHSARVIHEGKMTLEEILSSSRG